MANCRVPRWKTRKGPGKRTLQGRRGYIFVNTDCLGLYKWQAKTGVV